MLTAGRRDLRGGRRLGDGADEALETRRVGQRQPARGLGRDAVGVRNVAGRERRAAGGNEELGVAASPLTFVATIRPLVAGRVTKAARTLDDIGRPEEASAPGSRLIVW